MMTKSIRVSELRFALWQQIKELTFISAFFSWLFMLASRLAEPLMTLSVLYIIVEAGVPGVKQEALHTIAVAIMIASPEIMLPGSFVMASQAEAQRNARARWLYCMCWLFVALTVVTLISLFILKLSALAFSVVTCVRCAASVGYSILIRTLTYNQDSHTGSIVQQSEPMNYQEVAQHVIPLLVPHLRELRSTIVDEIKPLIPASELVPSVDYEEVAKAVAPLLMPSLIEAQRTFIEQVKTIVPQIVAPTMHQIDAKKHEVDSAEETEMEREVRLEQAYQELLKYGKRLSGRALAEAARCNRQVATRWLEARK